MLVLKQKKTKGTCKNRDPNRDSFLYTLSIMGIKPNYCAYGVSNQNNGGGADGSD